VEPETIRRIEFIGAESEFPARDVEPFLFLKEQQGRIATFRDYWRSK